MLRPALTLLVGGATGGIKPEHIRLGALLEWCIWPPWCMTT